MAFVIDGGAEIRLQKKERQEIGKEFKTWFDAIEESRRELMQETWIQALDNYEGKPPVKQFPWAGASNAFLPISGTHSDAIGARLYNAAIAHDPIFLLLHSRAGFAHSDELLDVTFLQLARWMQNISKFIEREEIPFKDLMEEIVMTMVIYGDAFVYIPWEKQETMDATFSADDKKIVFEPRTLWDGPRPKVIHPKDIYISWDAKNVQEARQVGMGWNLDLPTLEEYEAQGIYDKETVKRLKEILATKQERASRKVDALAVGNQLKEWGGGFYTEDSFEKEIKKRIGISDDSGPNALKMIKVFARADMDKDGIPEELIYDVVKEEGLVPYARYANYSHRQRPLVQFSYGNRPGSIYNRGVPELLFNIQKIMNTTIRDHLDNNKVQNTKMFLARKGSAIEENAKVYPSRIFFVDNIQTDFTPIDLGTGRPVTSINDIAVIEKWGQFITGITDFNLGKENRSRTPATTTLALLEEGNKRIDRTIEVMRRSMLEMWKQVLLLYFQNGDKDLLATQAVIGLSENPDEVTAEEDAFKILWDEMPADALFDGIALTAEVSSNALNRQAQRQEALALFQQVDQFYQRVTQLAGAIGGSAADPVMQQLFLLMTKGFRRVMAMVLDTFDVKDQEALNPDIEKLIQGVQSVPIDPAQGGGQAGPPQAGASNPAQEAAAVAGQAGQVTNAGTAPNRPVAGGQRPPNTTGGTQQ
jgi:hypothetical protein